MKKTCTICKKHLPLELYHIQSNRKDGRDSRCKSCVSKYKKQRSQRIKIKTDKDYYIVNEEIELHEDVIHQFLRHIGIF